ncbi:MAG: hypothetical protein J7577_10110 [Sphingobacteriaceae bacterium]|nr:hypothetical protein [Sphingobacteriaceae bacterium]
MKIPFKLPLLALICLLVTASCKKEIDYRPDWDASSMSGKVDGVLLKCTIATAQTYVIDGKTTLQLLGNKVTTGFSLVISDFKGVGTYTLSDSNIATYLPNNLGLQEAYLSTSDGTIKVTSYLAGQYIKGTFEFKGQNYATSATKTISEGQFNISLVPLKVPESNNSTNNLNAKVDGTAIGFTGEAVSINSPAGKLLTITTVNGDKRLAISINEYKGVGTYDLAKDGVGIYMKDQSQTGSFYADAGTLVITSEAGNKLKGTFFFSGANQNTTINTSVNITDGTFDLPLSKL